ncbi:MAG: hypothetical protein A2Y87_09250 [Bacteroidetes bacterium RBG_13_46_8]|nr:MAG: hypothetical protein A2Y87_09250 [Bacteroidetes bacterium RBG_13_46_8]
MTFFLSDLLTHGQSQLLQVIAASGGSGQNGSIAMAWTIGEPVISTLSGTGLILTQGFHQPEINGPDAIRVFEGPDYSIDAYPNPAVDFLILSLDIPEMQDFQYVLYDLNGTLLVQELLVSKQTAVDMTDYQAGIYVLKVIQSDQEIKIFKIVKP